MTASLKRMEFNRKRDNVLACKVLKPRAGDRDRTRDVQLGKLDVAPPGQNRVDPGLLSLTTHSGCATACSDSLENPNDSLQQAVVGFRTRIGTVLNRLCAASAVLCRSQHNGPFLSGATAPETTLLFFLHSPASIQSLLHRSKGSRIHAG